MSILCLLFAATLILWFRTSHAISYSSSGETLRNVLLTHSGSLIVGSNATLRKLDPFSLHVLQTVELQHGQVNRLLSDSPGGTLTDSFMSCTLTNCELRDEENISQRLWQGQNVLLNGSLNALGLFVTGPDGDFVFTAAQPNEASPSTIHRGNIDGIDGGEQVFSLYARQVESSIGIMRQFLSVFRSGGFSYYVNRFSKFLSDHYQIRVVRICNNDTGRDPQLFRSYYEIQLKCGSDTEPTAATYISDSSRPTSIIVSVASSSSSENQLCVYSLSEINRRLTIKYEDCRVGIGHSGLFREELRACTPLSDDQLNDLVSSFHLPFVRFSFKV